MRGEIGRVTCWSQTLRSWRRWTHRKSTRKDSMRKARKTLPWTRMLIRVDQRSKTTDGIRIICNTENFVPIVVPGLTSSSSSLLTSTHDTLWQEIDHPKSSSSSSTSPPMTSSTEIDYSDHPPAIVSSESVERQERRDPYYSDILEWLQEFRENLVDDEVPERRDSHASSSHEESLEPITKRREDLGKHNVHTHFPKYRNCEICQRTKITRAPCRRRIRTWMLCKKATLMTIGISMDQEICLIHGQVFTQFITKWETSRRIYVVRGETDKRQATSRPVHLWPELWTKLGRNAQLGPMKNQSSIMQEDYEESTSLTLRTRSSKKPLGPQEENWKHQWLQPCLARHARKTSMVRPVAWKPVNPQECVWKNLYQNIMRTILQEKKTIHCNITIWFTNLFRCFQALKNPAAKAAVDKEWEKLEKISAWNLTKVRSKKEVIDEARTKGATVLFCIINGHLLSEECWIGDKAPKIQRSTLRKMILDLIQNIQNKDHRHHKWRQQKSWISFPDCQGAMDKQLTQYPLTLRSKWKMHRRHWKFPNRNVQTFEFVYHDTYGQNRGPVWKTQSFLLSEICMVIFWQDCYGKAIGENPIEIRLGEGFLIGNDSSYTVKKGYSYPCMWMT